MSQPLSHHLLTMAYQNAWANHRLAKAWSQLEAADLVAPRVSFFPSIRLTLNHILTCDWFYVDALERELRGDEPHPDCYVFFNADEPFTEGAQLREEQAHVDRRLIAYCEQLRDADLAPSSPSPAIRRSTTAVCACFRTCLNISFITVARCMRCSAAPRWSRRNWMSFSVSARAVYAPRTLLNWAGLKS